MEQYTGTSAYEGIAIGQIFEMKQFSDIVRCIPVDDPDAEVQRFEAAREQADSELASLRKSAGEIVGDKEAALFDAHRLILRDANFSGSIRELIRSGNLNAEAAVDEIKRQYEEEFSLLNNDYMRERMADVRDVADRLIVCLSQEEEKLTLPENAVVVADDLTPSRVAAFDRKKILAVVLRRGSVISHAVILAKAMHLPTVIQAELPEGCSGKRCIVDGSGGTVLVSPDEETIEKYRKLRASEQEYGEQLIRMKNLETVTKSGKKVPLYANVGSAGDFMEADENGAEGIGLYRTEFFYLNRSTLPTEDTQFNYYCASAEMEDGKEIIIRTFDIGSDKKFEQSVLFRDTDPARHGILFCFDHPGLFRTQLRAICRASRYGDVRVMFPMIRSAEEFFRAKEFVSDVQKELADRKTEYRSDMPLGIMIETREAIASLDQLASVCDFFSIGSNDLTRAEEAAHPDLDAAAIQEILLQDIEASVNAGHRHGIRVCICGEMGSDPYLTGTFVKMGIDMLSMSPAEILPIRKIIRSME